MLNNKITEFSDYFKSLSERAQYDAGKQFSLETGGKLSAFNNPAPVTVALIPVRVQDTIKLLAVKRGIQPFIGQLAFPGGYVDHLEASDIGVAREVLEETGLDTKPEDYDIFGKLLISPNNHLLIFYKYKYVLNVTEVEDKLKLNSEVLGFDYVDITSTLCFPLHQEKLIEYFSTYDSQILTYV